MAANPYYPVNLAVPVQPGQARDPSRDAVFQKIQDVLNFLLQGSETVVSITDTDQNPNVLAKGDVLFSGAGVAQSGNGFVFSGGGGAGSVTSVGATAPIVATPNPIIGAGTISHANSGVAAGSYANPTIGLDIFGHVLSAVAGSPIVPAANAYGHTITAAAISFHMQQIQSGDTVQTLPQLIGAPDRGYLAFVFNISGGPITLNAHAGETINGAASGTIPNGFGVYLLGLAGAGSTGNWSG